MKNLDQLRWRTLEHGGRVRRTFQLDGGPITVRIVDALEGADGRTWASVEAVAAHRCAALPHGRVDLERLEES